MTTSKDLNEDGYLKIVKPVSNHLMYSENKFKKIAKIKLKVNNKALGSRYCGLLDDVILLGQALDNQPPEFELKLDEYRLVNLKDQVFDLVKEEVTLSLRFATEVECSDWSGMLDQSALYSYVTVDFSSRRVIPPKYKKTVDYQNVCKKRMSVPILLDSEKPNHYCYPRFSETPIKLDSCEYVKVDCKEEDAAVTSRDAITENSKASESLDTIPEMTRSSEVLTSHPPVLTRKPKTKNKLNRDRSMSS